MKNEPIINTGAVMTAIAGIVAFAVRMNWVHFNETQIAAIMTVLALVLPPLVGFIGRQWVSPTGQKVAAVMTTVEGIAAKPETKKLITEGESVINDVLAHAPTEGQAVAVAVAPAPSVPDGAPVVTQPAAPAV